MDMVYGDINRPVRKTDLFPPGQRRSLKVFSKHYREVRPHRVIPIAESWMNVPGATDRIRHILLSAQVFDDLIGIEWQVYYTATSDHCLEGIRRTVSVQVIMDPGIAKAIAQGLFSQAKESRLASSLRVRSKPNKFFRTAKVVGQTLDSALHH